MSFRRPIVIGLVLATALCAAPALSRAEASDHARTAGQARAAYTITASVNKPEPLRGKKVTIKGWVRPALPGGRIALQRELTSGDGWQTIDRAHLSKASTYRFTFRVIPARERAYRVVKPIGGHRSAGHSPVVTVTGYEWTPLSRLFEEPSGPSLIHVAETTIHGGYYPDSFESQATPFSALWSISSRCTTFKATLGLDDLSPILGRAIISVATDGNEISTGAYGIIDSERVVLDVRGASTLTLSGTTENDGHAVIGQPILRCTRPHGVP